MAPRVTENVRVHCEKCGREFEHAPRLPRQRYCPVCYYELLADLTGSLEEHVWRAGYNAGLKKREREDRAETLAKIAELLPLHDVIALCHPDRHPEERREQATNTTATLLELRSVLGDIT